ncbi:hypothetical protein N9157_01620 [Saprospiraceae bacterium]|nr:hypothetical protein [Saprospiraceae bacterium]
MALVNISQLLKPRGIFVFSLRNGPAGIGTHVFPTNFQKTIKDAKEYGFEVLLELDNQPSLMKNKERVKWSRIVLKKKYEKIKYYSNNFFVHYYFSNSILQERSTQKSQYHDLVRSYNYV